MKIACLEMSPENRMATGERREAILTFLRGRGHVVDILAPSSRRLNDFSRFRFSAWSRIKRRVFRRRFLPHLWDYVADDLQPRLEAGNYDAAIALAHAAAYTLTRCSRPLLKIFDMANIGFLESYHGWNADLSEIDIDYAKEMELYRAVDSLLLPHPILADFFRKHVYDHEKVKTVRLGCHLSERTARYSSMPRLVYAGSYSYIQDPYLLSLIARESPYPIDCYGERNPNYKFLPTPLNYCGFRPDTEFLLEYQCGVITVSQDRLRRHSPATKFAYYFAHGLPVLFPDWMEEGHTYEAAIPFSETTFADQVRSVCCDRANWTRLSDAARTIARELSWDRVMQPLDELLSEWARRRQVTPASL